MSRRWMLIVVSLLVVAGGAFAVIRWIGGDAPEEVSLNAAATSATDAGFDGSFDGTWSIDTASGSFSDFTSTWAGYRIEEELGGFGANTAVGRTPDVTGTLTVEATTIDAVSVKVDLTTLKSDRDMRDNALGRRGLETQTYPEATFTLTEPIALDAAPETGGTVKEDATGDFTLHGVTKRITIPLEGRWTGDRIEVVSNFVVALADYQIEKPTGMRVLSVDDNGTVELHLIFRKA
jgi:polyisoprenoid-binding protein YceI